MHSTNIIFHLIKPTKQPKNHISEIKFFTVNLQISLKGEDNFLFFPSGHGSFFQRKKPLSNLYLI